MDDASHADADSELPLVRVGQLDFAGIEEAAKEGHRNGLRALWMIFKSFEGTQHYRARRVAISRILRGYDNGGQAALTIVEDVWERARTKRNPTRFALNVIIEEFKAHGWI